jgi:Peptidase A4 family
MHTRGKFAKLAVVMMASLLVSISTLARAQGDKARAIYAAGGNVPTSIVGIRAYVEPPKVFNPRTASDVELAAYGFPPRPDKQADPDRYGWWERAMGLAKTRWNGELEPVPLSSKGQNEREAVPAITSHAPADATSTGPRTQMNVNAAGVILTNKLTKYNAKSSFVQAESIISVSRAQAPFSSSCTYDYKEFSFAGLDSAWATFSSDLYSLSPGLQGGVYGDVPCGGGGVARTPFYYTEFGWMYPLSRAFAVNPGDVVWAFVQATSASTGYVYLEDLTTQVYSSYSISTPGLIGHNVSWLVFTPCCATGSDPFPLANTANIFFDDASATTGGGGAFDAGSQAGSTLVLYMVDPGGSQNIEIVNQGSGGNEGKYAVSFQTMGCAVAGGCNP